MTFIFSRTCLQDTCKCEECYCDVLSVYAKLCMDAGVDVSGWRDLTDHCSKFFFLVLLFEGVLKTLLLLLL